MMTKSEIAQLPRLFSISDSEKQELEVLKASRKYKSIEQYPSVVQSIVRNDLEYIIANSDAKLIWVVGSIANGSYSFDGCRNVRIDELRRKETFGQLKEVSDRDYVVDCKKALLLRRVGLDIFHVDEAMHLYRSEDKILIYKK